MIDKFEVRSLIAEAARLLAKRPGDATMQRDANRVQLLAGMKQVDMDALVACLRRMRLTVRQ